MFDHAILVNQKKKVTTITSDMGMSDFTPWYYYEDLSPDIYAVTGPDNTFKTNHPIVSEEDQFHTPNRYNFDVTFECE